MYCDKMVNKFPLNNMEYWDIKFREIHNITRNSVQFMVLNGTE